jgi:hypothetical protein
MRNKLLNGAADLPCLDCAGEYRAASPNAACASRRAQAAINRIQRQNPNATSIDLERLYLEDEILKETGVPNAQVTEDWLCIDCGINTAPGIPDGLTTLREIEQKGASETHVGPDSEVYMVRETVWKAAGMEPFGGCLCIGCLERRLGRKLKPKDFPPHPFNGIPGSERLLRRRKYRHICVE